MKKITKIVTSAVVAILFVVGVSFARAATMAPTPIVHFKPLSYVTHKAVIKNPPVVNTAREIVTVQSRIAFLTKQLAQQQAILASLQATK